MQSVDHFHYFHCIFFNWTVKERTHTLIETDQSSDDWEHIYREIFFQYFWNSDFQNYLSYFQFNHSILVTVLQFVFNEYAKLTVILLTRTLTL